MRTTTTRLSLLALAIFLAHCSSQTATESGEPVDPTTKTDPTSTTEKGTADTRGGLSPISSKGTTRSRTRDLLADARAYAIDTAKKAGVLSPQYKDFHVAKGTDGLMHVRLEQRMSIDGESLKVWGADVVVHANDSSLFGLAGSLASDRDRASVEDAFKRARTPALDEASAIALAKTTRFGSDAESIKTSRETFERVVWLDPDAKPHVAVHTSFYNELGGGYAPGLWNYIFDAQSGDVLAKWNAIDTVSAQASGPGGNPKNVHSWTDELDVESKNASYVMTTNRLLTTDLKHSTTGNGSEIVAPLSGFDDAAIDDAHGYAEITLNMLSTWMGHNSIDDNGFVIVSRVHYGSNYENAFWNGAQMTYGDGASTFYPLSGAVDVVAHEINHGFTTKHSNLAYSGEPGGLNEGFSDIAGKTAEFFYKSNPSFNLGEDIFKQNGAALRYMCDPTKDGRSIDHASKMKPTTDPHYSSGVPNKAFCRIAKRLSSGDADGTATQAGVKRAAVAFYEANAHYWTASTTFVQGCQGTVDAARALGYSDDEVAAIKTSWIDVGVYCDGASAPPPPCDVVLTDATGEVTSPDFPNNYPANVDKTVCIDGPSVTLTFTDFDTEGSYDFVTVMDAKGKELSKTSGTTKPGPFTTANRIYVKFTSDESVQKKGFRATWTQ
jgi:Zn-dependent metalloprotease